MNMYCARLSKNLIFFVYSLVGNSLASEIQTPVNYPQESTQHSKHGECLKPRINFILLMKFKASVTATAS